MVNRTAANVLGFKKYAPSPANGIKQEWGPDVGSVRGASRARIWDLSYWGSSLHSFWKLAMPLSVTS